MTFTYAYFAACRGLRRPHQALGIGWANVAVSLALWPVRLFLLAEIVLMAPSRVLMGEHWPSDVMAGLLYGAFWLLVGVHAFTKDSNDWTCTESLLIRFLSTSSNPAVWVMMLRKVIGLPS